MNYLKLIESEIRVNIRKKMRSEKIKNDALTYVGTLKNSVPDFRIVRCKRFDGGKINITLRYDDSCRNGHRTFGVTGELWEYNYSRRHAMSFGCLHDDIKKYFPEYAHLIKYHLCSEDGPLHYVANTTYHMKQGALQYARSCAIGEDLTVNQLLDIDFLYGRLPDLMTGFFNNMKELNKQ